MTFVAITSGVPAQFISVRAKNTPSAWRSSCCASVHPFRAGNALMTATIPVEQAVHPRACGERTPLGHLRVRRRRFIPVRAGNAGCADRGVGAMPVHPRACGERVTTANWLALVAGSSPCVRGTLYGNQRVRVVGRFIPVRAGNAPFNQAGVGSPAVHPRACGERGVTVG